MTFRFIRNVVLSATLAAFTFSEGWTQPADSRWESDIQAFEEADRENPPPEGAILFVGSSSIRGWRTVQEDFPEYQILNRGFGGSQISDCIQFVDRIVIPYRPSMIVFYAGENDISAGKSPEEVAEDFQRFVRLVRDAEPKVRIAFISMKPSPRRWHLADTKKAGNRLIQDFVSSAPGIDYIDVWEAMLDQDGEPRADIFIGDRLHMNAAGYSLWKDLVAPYLQFAGTSSSRRGPEH